MEITHVLLRGSLELLVVIAGCRTSVSSCAADFVVIAGTWDGCWRPGGCQAGSDRYSHDSAVVLSREGQVGPSTSSAASSRVHVSSKVETLAHHCASGESISI